MKKETRRGKPAITLLILGIIYTIISATIGFPLGFGTPMARHIAKEYAQQIYPYSTFGKTGFNPVASRYYTLVNYEGNEFSVETMPTSDRIIDSNRSDLILEKQELQDIHGKLNRQYFAAQDAGYAYIYLHYSPENPMETMATMQIKVRDNAYFPDASPSYEDNINALIQNYYSVLSEYFTIDTLTISTPEGTATLTQEQLINSTQVVF